MFKYQDTVEGGKENGKKYEYFEERLVDCLMNGGKVTYYDIEDNEPYVLTLEKFKEGIAKLEKEHDWEYWEDYSDEVLQVCLFGKRTHCRRSAPQIRFVRLALDLFRLGGAALV